MCADATEPGSSAERLRELLLDYLRATRVSTWPGADGLTLADVLNCDPEGLGAWEASDWERFVRDHPELAAAIQKWLAGNGRRGLPP
jgi:hypothetical protein